VVPWPLPLGAVARRLGRRPIFKSGGGVADTVVDIKVERLNFGELFLSAPRRWTVWNPLTSEMECLMSQAADMHWTGSGRGSPQANAGVAKGVVGGDAAQGAGAALRRS